jgi:hypothetical protein
MKPTLMCSGGHPVKRSEQAKDQGRSSRTRRAVFLSISAKTQLHQTEIQPNKHGKWFPLIHPLLWKNKLRPSSAFEHHLLMKPTLMCSGGHPVKRSEQAKDQGRSSRTRRAVFLSISAKTQLHQTEIQPNKHGKWFPLIHPSSGKTNCALRLSLSTTCS